MNILKPHEIRILEKYLDNLQVLTDVIGEEKTNKNGAVLRFKARYGGGEARFPNKNEMLQFIVALYAFADNIK